MGPNIILFYYIKSIAENKPNPITRVITGVPVTDIADDDPACVACDAAETENV